jgi:hypothetical protein
MKMLTMRGNTNLDSIRERIKNDLGKTIHEYIIPLPERLVNGIGNSDFGIRN